MSVKHYWTNVLTVFFSSTLIAHYKKAIRDKHQLPLSYA